MADDALTWVHVNDAQDTLRQEHRIKKNTDYALAVKYGKVHVLCALVYEETIREVLHAHGVEVATLATYD